MGSGRSLHCDWHLVKEELYTMYFLPKQLPELKDKTFIQRHSFQTSVIAKSKVYQATLFIPCIIIFIIGTKYSKFFIFTEFEDKTLNMLIPMWIALTITGILVQFFALNFIFPKYKYEDIITRP